MIDIDAQAELDHKHTPWKYLTDTKQPTVKSKNVNMNGDAIANANIVAKRAKRSFRTNPSKKAVPLFNNAGNMK